MEKKKEKLSFIEKLGYSFTAMGSDMTTQTTGSFLQLFYTSVVGIPAWLSGLVVSLSTIWDAINDPLIASWVDNHKFKNGERMRPVLLFSCVPFALCFIAIFSTLPNADLATKTWYSFIWYFIYMIPRTFYFLPVFTLRQVATNDIEERLSLNQFVSYGQAVGSSLPSLVMWNLMYTIGGIAYIKQGDKLVKVIENPEKGYLGAAIITAIVVVVCSLINYFTTKERVIRENKKQSIFDAMKILVKDKNFILNLVIFFFYGMCVTLTTGYAAYYCNFVAQSPDEMMYISAMFIVGTVLATPFVKKMYNKFGRTKTMIIGSAVLAVGALVFGLFGYFTTIPAYFFTFCVGIGTAITIIVIGINRAEVTDVIEWKEGVRMDGMVSNVSSFIKKLAHALIVFLLGVLLSLFGFQEATAEVKYPVQPESAKICILVLMSAGVLISSLLMAYFSTKVTLDDEIKKHKESLGE